MSVYENVVNAEEQARADAAQFITNYELIRRDYNAYRKRQKRTKRRVLVGGEHGEIAASQSLQAR